MFENNSWNIAEENFDYLIGLLKRRQIDVSISSTSSDLSGMNLSDCQFYEDHCVSAINKTREAWRGEEPIIPRVMNLDMFTHQVMLMRIGDTVRRICFSKQKKKRIEDGSWVKNIDEFTENLSNASKTIYQLACQISTACGFWEYFVANDFCAWSNVYSKCTTDKEKEYSKNIFDYRSNTCQSLVDIFDQDGMEDLVDCFTPICCGKKMKSRNP